MHDDSIRGATRHDERSFTIERADVIGTESAPEPSGAPEVPEGIAALTTRQLAWRRFRRHKLAIISTGVLIGLTLLCIIGPIVSKYNYHQLDLLHLTQKPSHLHWFGTDNLGRDEFVRVLYGGRISLAVGLSVALSAGIVGASVGSYAGYYGGWV